MRIRDMIQKLSVYRLGKEADSLVCSAAETELSSGTITNVVRSVSDSGWKKDIGQTYVGRGVAERRNKI